MATRQPLALSLAQYAVLATLAQQPRSGYDIAQWFQRMTHHFWAAGHSSVYPTLADLEQRSLVSHTEVPSEQGPVRKVYALTPAGERLLLDWVAQPAADAEVKDEQMLKAMCYGFLPADQAISLLRLARARHVERQTYYEELAESIRQDAELLPPDAAHERAAALGRLLTSRRGIGVQQSYVAWCDAAIASLECGELQPPTSK